MKIPTIGPGQTLIDTTKAFHDGKWVDVVILYDSNRIHDLAAQAAENKGGRSTSGALTAVAIGEATR